MANITEFDTPIGLVPQPSDRAASTAREAGTAKNIYAREAGQELGGAISKVGGQVGAEIDRHNTMAQIGHGAATYSSLWSDLTQQWNELASKSDPNDTSIQQGFKEKVLEPSLEKFQQAFDGATDKAQEWALQRADSMRQHFSEKTSADMGIRAGAAVQKNVGDLERNYSNGVMADPTSLGHVAESIKTDVKAMVQASPYITAAEAARIQNEVVPKVTKQVAQAAFDGLAQRDPKEALRQLDHGDFNDYADGTTQATWRRYAEAQDKVQTADAKRDALAAKVQFKEDSADHAEEYRQQMYNPDTGRILNVNPKLNQRILQDAQLTKADKNFLILWNETQYKAQVAKDKADAEGAPVVSNAKVLADLRKRVGDPDQGTTRQEVLDAQAAGQLSIKDAHDTMWRVGQQDAAFQAMQRPFKAQFAKIQSLAFNSMTSTLKYLPAEEQSARLNQVEADAQRIVRNAYASRDPNLMREVLDPQSPKWAFREALHSITGATPAAGLKEQADAVRNTERKVPEYATEAEAKAANIVPGTPVKVGGVLGRWQE